MIVQWSEVPEAVFVFYAGDGGESVVGSRDIEARLQGFLGIRYIGEIDESSFCGHFCSSVLRLLSTGERRQDN